MADSPHIVALDETNFMQVVVEGSDHHPVLVDFWADWCGPCKSLMPILEKLAVEYDGAFVLAKLDTEAHPAIAQQLGIRSLPTVKLFRNRQLVDEFMGALPEPDVRRFLEAHVGTPQPVEDDTDDTRSPAVREAERLVAAGDLDQARAVLQAAQAETPDDPEVLLALAQVLVELGDLDAARTCLDILPDDARERPDARRLAGMVQLASDADRSRTPAELEAAVAADPADADSRYQLAIATALAGDVAAAMDQLLVLVQRDPGFRDGAARKQLLALFDVLGDDPLVGRYRRKLFAMLH